MSDSEEEYDDGEDNGNEWRDEGDGDADDDATPPPAKEKAKPKFAHTSSHIHDEDLDGFAGEFDRPAVQSDSDDDEPLSAGKSAQELAGGYFICPEKAAAIHHCHFI